MEQLMALGVVPGDPDSATKAFIALKEELVKEKAARQIARAEVETLTRAVGDLKILANRFAAQISVLKDKVMHLDNKVIDGLNELRAKELCLEHTTNANVDFRSQNTRLTSKLESKLP
jgi:VIT1/CCC1 family predicted Fe2+/Mn2+ transporter